MPTSNSWLVITVKHSAKDYLYTSKTIFKIILIYRILDSINYEVPAAHLTSSQVTVLLLATVLNGWSETDNIHTKFCENLSTGSRAETQTLHRPHKPTFFFPYRRQV
jgi:hypothetical protein